MHSQGINTDRTRFPWFIMVTGPTGVGKSDFAEQLAKAVNGEIVNCDMGQLYEPFTIGTAKPILSQVEMPHHLFDILTEPINFTAAQYRERVIQVIDDLVARGKLPILVGGSGFYMSGLFFKLHESSGEFLKRDEVSSATNVSASPQTSVDFPRNESAAEAVDSQWKKLSDIDFARAQKIHPNDTYRIERALEIWQRTGKPPSAAEPEFMPIRNPFLVIHITREREELYERINARTHLMFDAGWVEETQNLSDEWKSFLQKKKLIGYPEIIDYLEKGTERAAVITAIQKNTRHYAKRQLTFWRMFHKKIEQFCPGSSYEANLTLSSIDLYIKQLLARF